MSEISSSQVQFSDSSLILSNYHQMCHALYYLRNQRSLNTCLAFGVGGEGGGGGGWQKRRNLPHPSLKIIS